jgi:hypothetical protein
MNIRQFKCRRTIVTIGVFFIISFNSIAYSQCIDRKKITWGGDYGNYNYSYLCPEYFFSYGGDTAKNWNIHNNNIDINQAPPNALKFKHNIELIIKKHAGNDFYKNLKFYNVSVVYPKRLKLFIDSGAQVSLKHYHAKYFYCYGFEPDTLTAYLIGIAVNKKGKIVYHSSFPSKAYYKTIDKKFTYCQLIEIARKAQKNIDPIDEIKFEYDEDTKRFYWNISQALVNPHEGINYINQVMIDAADLGKVSTVKSSVSVNF